MRNRDILIKNIKGIKMEKRKIGVVVLGNSKGVASANVHYLAKMLYSEMKINKIKF